MNSFVINIYHFDKVASPEWEHLAANKQRDKKKWKGAVPVGAFASCCLSITIFPSLNWQFLCALTTRPCGMLIFTRFSVAAAFLHGSCWWWCKSLYPRQSVSSLVGKKNLTSEFEREVGRLSGVWYGIDNPNPSLVLVIHYPCFTFFQPHADCPIA